MKTKRLVLRIAEGELAYIDEACQAVGCTRSQLMRSAAVTFSREIHRKLDLETEVPGVQAHWELVGPVPLDELVPHER